MITLASLPAQDPDQEWILPYYAAADIDRPLSLGATGSPDWEDLRLRLSGVASLIAQYNPGCIRRATVSVTQLPKRKGHVAQQLVVFEDASASASLPTVKFLTGFGLTEPSPGRFMLQDATHFPWSVKPHPTRCALLTSTTSANLVWGVLGHDLFELLHTADGGRPLFPHRVQVHQEYYPGKYDKYTRPAVVEARSASHPDYKCSVWRLYNVATGEHVTDQEVTFPWLRCAHVELEIVDGSGTVFTASRFKTSRHNPR